MDLYHVLNRGVDKRNIFLDEKDYIRFIHNMYEFNNLDNINPNHRLNNSNHLYNSKRRETLIKIHGWCLMKNHYHLLLSENNDGGLTKFIRRINIGYAKYFNEKYNRVGTFFQGRTKKVLISSDRHFLYILHYIHLNPLDYIQQSKYWREQKIKDFQNALSHLEKYKWSSYRDYIGTRNFPSILFTDLFDDVFQNYRNEISSYLKSAEINLLTSFPLE